MKKRKFNKIKDMITVFFTVQTAQDFDLNIKDEVITALDREGVEVPGNINDLIQWSSEEAVA